jgi:hypothetical protein
MNEIKKNILNNSKRYANLKLIHKQLDINKHKNDITSSSSISMLNSKYIIIPLIKKRKFLPFTFTKAKLKLLFYSSLLGITFYNLPNISKYFTNFQDKNITENSKKYLNTLLTSEEIKLGGIELLDKIFKDEKSKQAVIILLKDLLENGEVFSATKQYGVDLFSSLLKEDELKQEVKKLFIEILTTPEIKTEGVEILKYIIEKEESKDIMAQYFKVIFLRADIIKALSNVISDSAIHTMNSATTKKKFSEFVADVWSDPNLRWYVIKRALNFWQKANATVKNENVEGVRVITNEAEKVVNLESIPVTNAAIMEKEGDNVNVNVGGDNQNKPTTINDK